MKKKIYRLFNKSRSFVKRYVFIDPIFVQRQKFKRDEIRFDLSVTYPLTSGSIVFEVGGYLGETAVKLVERYDCNIYIFEPVKEFMDKAREKLKGNPKVHFLDFGLSDKDAEEVISSNGDGSSVFAEGKMTIQLKDVKKFVEDLKVNKIDLLILNIEGGEFKVLPRMIECGLIPLCTYIQIQFHDFFPEAKRLRKEIRTKLFETHYLIHEYPWTFENWKKK